MCSPETPKDAIALGYICEEDDDQAEDARFEWWEVPMEWVVDAIRESLDYDAAHEEWAECVRVVQSLIDGGTDTVAAELSYKVAIGVNCREGYLLGSRSVLIEFVDGTDDRAPYRALERRFGPPQDSQGSVVERIWTN